MASHTPNLNLTLPIGAEKVSRQIINTNMTLIDTAVGGKVNVADIVDNLTTNDPTKVLSAAQGYALNSKLQTEDVTSEFTLGNTITLEYNCFKVYKTGNRITMCFRGGTSATGNDPVIATVPDKYKPLLMDATACVAPSCWVKNDFASVNYYNAAHAIVFAAKCYTTNQAYSFTYSWLCA